MANTISGTSIFNRLNTTSSDFKILTGIDKVYSNQLPKKEDLEQPENKDSC